MLLRGHASTFIRATIFASIGAAAYFDARGAWHLVAAELPSPIDLPPAETSARPRAPAPPFKSARSVLERNPFDSVTGSLLGEPTGDTESPRTLDLSDPLNAPRCDDLRVYATAESADPLWSLAIAQHKDAPRSEAIRVGDVLGSFQVAYIGHNRVEGSPAVWFLGSDGLCQSFVFSERPRFRSASAAQPPPKAPPPRKKRKPRRKKKRAPPALPRELARGIEKVSSDEYRIDQDVVDTLLQKGPDLLRSTRVVPVRENGRVAGMRVSNIGRNSLLAKLGLKEGDRVDTINGFEVTTPEAALKAYSTVQRAKDLSVTLKRGGKPMTLDIKIR